MNRFELAVSELRGLIRSEQVQAPPSNGAS